MFIYILIGCFITVITDYICCVMMNNRGITSLTAAAFIAVFWPMVVIYLVFYLMGELFNCIGGLGNKKK